MSARTLAQSIDRNRARRAIDATYQAECAAARAVRPPPATADDSLHAAHFDTLCRRIDAARVARLNALAALDRSAE